MARSARHLEKGGCGATSLENSLQRCSVGAAGKKHSRPEQDEGGTPSHCLGMKPMITRIPTLEEFDDKDADFTAKQAEIYHRLILKFSGN